MTKTYNFDEIIDRSGSGDLKHEALLPRWGRNDLLPLWVADMDFATPDFVVDALKERLDHPIFGYTVAPQTTVLLLLIGSDHIIIGMLSQSG